MHIILGIDPGSRSTGFGIIGSAGSNITHIAHGTIKVTEKAVADRLYQLYQAVVNTIVDYQPHTFAIEQVFMHRNPQSALKLGQARSAAMIAAAQYQLTVHEYSPREVKQATVGYGAASKEQVQHMVATLLKLKTKPQSDAADALAIAICHNHHHRVTSKLKMAHITAGEGS